LITPDKKVKISLIPWTSATTRALKNSCSRKMQEIEWLKQQVFDNGDGINKDRNKII
jgi:hypothetical protein